MQTVSFQKKQFGIGKGLSISKALYSFVDEILCPVHSETQVGGLFCDYAAALD
jgi:hypothetical protein